MKVVVLTTSYPRDAGDAAGRFVADAVEHLRERGVDVDDVQRMGDPVPPLLYFRDQDGNTLFVAGE